MAFRGSLKACVNRLGNLFAFSRSDFLSIVRVPNGKYYTVLTDSELAERPVTSEEGEARLVFRGTLRELQQFTNTSQTDLFEVQTKSNNGSAPSANNQSHTASQG